MYNIANKILKICSIVFLTFLAIVSFFFTQRTGKKELGEIINGAPIYQESDNIILNVVILILICALLLGLHTAVSRITILQNERFIKCIQIITSIMAGIIAYLILSGGQRTPIDDQVQVYSAAALFNQDNYINMSKGGYVNMYPQQLGLILYIQLLFRIFGNGNYYVFQLINCFFIGGSVYFACKCINQLTEKSSIRILCAVSFLFVFPLFLLSSWVYGDVPSFFFIFMLFYYYLSFYSKHKKIDLFFGILAACFSLIFRKNSIIILLAIGIVSVVQFFIDKNKKILIQTAVLCILPFLVVQGINIYYEKVSSYSIDGGIPSIMWITMGTIEDGSKPGWFNNFCVSTYYANDCDKTASIQESKTKLKEQLRYFTENPVYAASFYKRKICTQWNDPFYGTDKLIDVDENIVPNGITLILLQYQDQLRELLSGLQFIIYLGTLIYALRSMDKKYFYKNCFPTTILGGFLFSILWEANSRYILPYFLIMIPLALIGLEEFVNTTAKIIYKLHTNKQ